MQSEAQKQKQEQLIASVAALIAISEAPKPAIANKIATLYTAAGVVVPFAVLLAVTELALSKPIIRQGTRGSLTAVSRVQSREDEYRAAYLIAASQRVAGEVRAGATVDEAMKKEQRHWKAHLDAQQRRFDTAKAVDAAARRYGPELGWYAKMDNRTSAECRNADGKNFTATQPPAIGFPGSVHRFCRCKPGKPHPGAPNMSRKAA